MVVAILVENRYLRKKNKELIEKVNKRNDDFGFLLSYTLTAIMNQASEIEDYKTAAECQMLIQKLNASQTKAKNWP